MPIWAIGLSVKKEGVKRGEGGAEDRLASQLWSFKNDSSQSLKVNLHFDIFVRWKPIEESTYRLGT